MFHLLNFKKILTLKQKKYVGGSIAIPRAFWGIPSACTRTLAKVLQSAWSDRQTDKSYGYLTSF